MEALSFFLRRASLLCSQEAAKSSRLSIIDAGIFGVRAASGEGKMSKCSLPSAPARRPPGGSGASWPWRKPVIVAAILGLVLPTALAAPAPLLHMLIF